MRQRNMPVRRRRAADLDREDRLGLRPVALKERLGKQVPAPKELRAALRVHRALRVIGDRVAAGSR